MLKRLVSTSVLVVLVFAAASGANAFTSDKRTYFTFSQPVALPGVTLPAGTYMFRLADPNTSRRTIQVSNAKGTESYAILLTMPSERLNPSPDPEIRFLETASGAPAAVRAWWYPGNSIGYEFIYPEEQLQALKRGAALEPSAAAGAAGRAGDAREEAARGDVPPIEDPVTSPDVVEGEGVPDDGEIGVDSDEPQAQIAEALPQAQQPPPAAPAPQRQTPDQAASTREQLPQTASPLPLILIGGMASAFAGWRMLRRR